MEIQNLGLVSKTFIMKRFSRNGALRLSSGQARGMQGNGLSILFKLPISGQHIAWGVEAASFYGSLRPTKDIADNPARLHFCGGCCTWAECGRWHAQIKLKAVNRKCSAILHRSWYKRKLVFIPSIYLFDKPVTQSIYRLCPVTWNENFFFL